MVIQKYLIRYLLSPLAQMMDKFSERTKNILFILAGMGIVLQNFAQNMSLVKYRFLIFFAVDCVFLGIMILCSMGKEIKPVKFRWPLAACWFAVGFLMLQSGIRNNADYLPEAMLFLVAFPIMFICWNNADHTRIFKLLLDLCEIGVLVFIIASFLFGKITEKRYPGIFNNTNGAAYYLAVAFVCLLVKIMASKRIDWKCVFHIFVLGITCALLYYTNSRTGPLGIIFAVIGGLALYMLTHSWKDNAKCFVRLTISAIVCALCVSSMVYVFQYRKYLPLPYYNAYSGEFYYEKSNVSDEADLDGSKVNHADKNADKMFDTSGFHSLAQTKGDMENKSLDQYSTGRITIWKEYAKQLNWFGHASTPKIYIDSLYQEISSTHMTILQVAFESGIFAGIFYFLLNISTGLVTIWFAWKRRDEPYAIMPLMITLVFGVMSMLGSCGVSLWYMTTIYYYFVQFPIVVDKPVEITLLHQEK